MRQRECRIESRTGAVRDRLVAVRAVAALMALRGVDLITATTFLAEIGDLLLPVAAELMAYLGLVRLRIPAAPR